MQRDPSFRAAYQELEARMKVLAERDGDIFLPNPEPEGRVDYLLICMEPSLGRWASSAEEARSRVESGFRNFLSSIEDFILHFCVRRYLCSPAERYHMTDFSKGAMRVERAGLDRILRYNRWYSLLREEVELCTTANSAIIAVGGAVAQHLTRREFPRPFSRVIHYSGQAARARRDGIAGREDDFNAFNGSVCLDEILSAAEQVFQAAQAAAEIRDKTMARLAGSQLTTSRQQLIFNYKVAFESLRETRR